MQTEQTPSVALLLTGNELMTGDIVDSNSAMMASDLLDIGLTVNYKATIADDMTVLVSELQRLSALHDVLIVNGGLGPTRDDLTAEALALACGTSIEEHPEALAHLTELFETKGFTLNAANLKQAALPKGALVVANPVGSAVGFKIELNDCLVICTPGVPSELKVMLKQEISPLLRRLTHASNDPLRERLRVFGMGESGLQQSIYDHFPDWPEAIELGFRASLPLLELKLQSKGENHRPLLATWRAKVIKHLGAHFVTDTGQSLAAIVIDQLRERNQTMTCAESCTGGLIASQITAVSGASGVFEAGFVTYSNAIKTKLLQVPEKDLQQHGAVSDLVVRQMLKGALQQSSADIGVAVSGIAGPDGGSDDKPVGLVWIAWGRKDAVQSKAFYLPVSRVRFQQIVAAMALDLVRRELMGLNDAPLYFEERGFKVSAV